MDITTLPYLKIKQPIVDKNIEEELGTTARKIEKE